MNGMNQILGKVSLWVPYQWLCGIAGVLAALNVFGLEPRPLAAAERVTRWAGVAHSGWSMDAARWIAERHGIIGPLAVVLLLVALVGARGDPDSSVRGRQVGGATALAAWALMDQVGPGGALAALVFVVVFGAALAAAARWIPGMITTADEPEGEPVGPWLRESLESIGAEVLVAFFHCLYPVLVLTFGRVPSERRAVHVYGLPGQLPVYVELVQKPSLRGCPAEGGS